MDLNSRILSDIIVHTKYARFVPELNRRETWDELIERNMMMHIKKFPQLKEEILAAYTYVLVKKTLPSMRSIQFGGKPIELSPNRAFNCSYIAVDDVAFFSELMFLLLGGTGVGYSVQRHHVAKLPPIRKPLKNRRFVVADSIEGWADAVKYLIRAYLEGGPLPRFDFGDIRRKGAQLVTSGGKAPGPEPLKECLFQIQKILDRKEEGSQLTPLECHDIACYIADAVLAGGIRRAAMISLFSFEDEEMMSCKFGDWAERNPQRGRANNSVVLIRNRIKEEDFWWLWERIRASGAGEPGLFFTDDKDWGVNPCGEVGLHTCQFCNVCEVNVSDVENQQDFEDRVRAAAFIGTLQASYTDFHYLREEWKTTTEKEALLGIGMTGIASGKVMSLDLEAAAKVAVAENIRVAKMIGIRPAARVCCVKPSGTTSLVLGCSSGVHAWHAPYYIRRMRLGKNEAVYQYLTWMIPDLLEDDFFKPNIQAVLGIPIKAPEGAVLRTEHPLDTLERVKSIYQRWVIPGHRKGTNTHNISCTISIKPDQWKEVGEWMWANRKYYAAISVLPFDGGTYVQTPFEDCTKEKYEQLSELLAQIDMANVEEMDDNTKLIDQAACGGGSCEVR